MSDLATFSASSLWAFLQVFTRVSALFVSAPVFGNNEIPAQTKIGLAGIISLVLLPIIRHTLMQGAVPALEPMIGALLGEVLIGLLIGFVVSLLFFAIRLGGELLDYQIGFTQAATFNPQFNELVSPIADFQYRYSLVIYLLINGQWLLLAALERSFIVLPALDLSLGQNALAAFTNLTFQMMVTGIEIAAPGAAVLLITDVAFAFLSRAMPQIQIFYVGMPLKVIVGFVVVMLTLPLLTSLVAHEVVASPTAIAILLQGMHR
jgi:flagellar biosynthetic protein FliR